MAYLISIKDSNSRLNCKMYGTIIQARVLQLNIDSRMANTPTEKNGGECVGAGIEPRPSALVYRMHDPISYLNECYR